MFANFAFIRRLVALRCPLLSELVSTRSEQVAVSLPASGPVVEGLIKMMDGQLITSDEGHTLKEVNTNLLSENSCYMVALIRWSIFRCCLDLADQTTSQLMSQVVEKIFPLCQMIVVLLRI